MDFPRILITRLSHIGDCVLTVPLLDAIRKRYPQAFIAWAVESPSHHLLKNHAGIDQLIMIPKAWLGKPMQWLAIRQQLREFQFDIAIDPQGLTKSSMLGWLSGAPRRVGAAGRWGRELSPWFNNALVAVASDHVVDRSLELLTELDIAAPPVNLNLPTDADDDASIETWLVEHDIERFAVINPGGSWESKRWENERFGEVAKTLYENDGLRTVVTWAGEEELAMANEIVAANPIGSILAPPTKLSPLASLLARADFFIGCDTGPMHISAAVGTPCVGLYGTTLPEESGAYGDQNIAVQKWYQSGSCKQRRKASNDAMRDIQVTDVANACQQMISNVEKIRAAA